MTKRLLMAMLALSMAATSVACGDDDDDDSEDGGDGDGDGGDGDGDSGDNVAACENWKDSIDCGDPNLEQALGSINCDSYGSLTCDISDYFDCLTENTSCENDTLNYSGWGNCASKASCQ